MTIRGRGTNRGAGAPALAALLVAALVAAAASTAGAQVDPIDGTGDQPARPSVYGGNAAAFSYQAFVDTVPVTFVPEPVKPTGPLASVAFDSAGRSDARGSLLDPGRLGTDGTSLLCQFGFPCTDIPLPRYPLAATASYPTVLDDVPDVNGTMFGDGALSGVLGDARAHADLDGAQATATTSRLLLGGATPALAIVGVGSANAESSVAFEGDVLVATSHAVLNDIAIGTGLLRIDSLEVFSTSRASASGLLENESRIEMGGARLAGMPVTIDGNGINFVGTPLDGGLLGLLGQTLTGLLEVAGGSVRLVGTSDDRDPGRGASADAVGLLVELELDVSLLSQLNLNPLGLTAVRVGLLLGVASSSARTLGGLDDGDADVAAPVVPSEPSTVVVPGTPGVAGTPSIPAVIGTGASAVLRSLIVDRAIRGDGLLILYAVMAVSVAAGAVASRQRPIRLARRR